MTGRETKAAFNRGVRGNGGAGHPGPCAHGHTWKHVDVQTTDHSLLSAIQLCSVLQLKGTVWLWIENTQGETIVP